MGVLEIVTIAVVIVLIDVFAVSYRWARLLVGSPEPEQIPAARVASGRHRGFSREPRWVRPVQAVVVALGVMWAVFTGLCLAAFVAVWILG
jgi:hypothetical protein